MEVVDDVHEDKAKRDWSHVGRCRSISRVRSEDTNDIPSHRLPGAQLWIGSSQNCLVFRGRPLHGTPREVSGSMSMQPVGYTPWCTTDAVINEVEYLRRIYVEAID